MNGKSDGKSPWWRRWLVEPVMQQLTQGISPEKLAWTIALGVTLGIFPVLGTRAFLCLFAGWALKLNQPVLHSFKGLCYPLHLALIVPFIRMGEWLYGVDRPVKFALRPVMERFKSDPLGFWQDFGWVIAHAVSAWLLIAPVLVFLIRFAATPVLHAAARKMPKRC